MMRMAIATLAAGLALVDVSSAIGRDNGFGNENLANAAGSLLTVDMLRNRCPAAHQSPLADEIARWEKANRAGQLRQAIGRARAEPGGEERYLKMRSALEQMLSVASGRECDMLKRWIETPESHIAGAFDRDSPFDPRSVPSSNSLAGSEPSGHGGNPDPPVQARRDILGYGLVQAYGTGYGGMITVRFKPVVLFKSGDLLTDLKGLADGSDRRSHPERWSRWRQAGATYQYQKTDGSWGSIYNNKVWTSAPAALLSGTYVSTGGTGNLSMGGSDTVFVRSSFSFQPGSRVLREGFAGSSSSVSDGGSTANTVTRSGSGPRSGRYVISGLSMTIRYDDGALESVTFMSHPTDPNIIWVNGIDYIRRK